MACVRRLDPELLRKSVCLWLMKHFVQQQVARRCLHRATSLGEAGDPDDRVFNLSSNLPMTISGFVGYQILCVWS